MSQINISTEKGHIEKLLRCFDFKAVEFRKAHYCLSKDPAARLQRTNSAVGKHFQRGRRWGAKSLPGSVVLCETGQTGSVGAKVGNLLQIKGLEES